MDKLPINNSKNQKSNSGISVRDKIQFYLIDSNTDLGKFIDVFIILLNIFIVFTFIIETYPISTDLENLLLLIESIVVLFFAIEYIARLYGAKNRIKHIFSIYSIIDLAAISPDIIVFFFDQTDIGILKLLRMFRVFRVLRFLRFFETSEFFFGNISSEILKVLRLIMTIFMIFFVASGLFFIVESGVDAFGVNLNDKVNNFGDAFYFMVVTLTTVGFGDITPISGAGKFITVLCILSGIAIIPWQIAEIIKEWLFISDKVTIKCKSCGLLKHDHDAIHCKSCGKIIYHEHE